MARLLVVVAAAALFAGAAFAGSTDPQKRHTPADMAKARAIVLRAADLGAGWKREPPDNSQDDFVCPGYNPDLSKLVETGDVESDFSDRFALASSEVTLYRSAGDARAAWATYVRPEVPGCLRYIFEHEKTVGVATKILSSTRLSFPRAAPRTIAFRVAANLTTQGATIPTTIDIIVLGSGRVEATLGAVGYGAPFPRAKELRLARILAARMR